MLTRMLHDPSVSSADWLPICLNGQPQPYQGSVPAPASGNCLSSVFLWSIYYETQETPCHRRDTTWVVGETPGFTFSLLPGTPPQTCEYLSIFILILRHYILQKNMKVHSILIRFKIKFLWCVILPLTHSSGQTSYIHLGNRYFTIWFISTKSWDTFKTPKKFLGLRFRVKVFHMALLSFVPL